MTAQEARTITDSIYIPLDAIFSQIKSQSEAGLSYPTPGLTRAQLQN